MTTRWRFFALTDAGELTSPVLEWLDITAYVAPATHDGPVLYAHCDKGHEPPAPGCGCGMYYTQTKTRVTNGGTRSTPPLRLVQAAVEPIPPILRDPNLWGRLAGDGRARAVQLLELYVHPDVPADLIGRLGEEYQVTVRRRGAVPGSRELGRVNGLSPDELAAALSRECR